jgi:hypothetical protein
MLRNRRIMILVLAIVITWSIGLAPQVGDGVQSVLAQSGKVYADGYYDSAGGAYIFSGARADMECSFPAIRDGHFSIMRVGVAHKNLLNPTNDAFIETGCTKDIYRFNNESRYVYGSWLPVGGVYDDRIFYILNQNYTANDYRVAIKNDNPNTWSFIFNGVVSPETISIGFTRGASTVCGGEASSSLNAIGPAACWNVRYKNNNLTSWVAIPSYQTRVSPGYTVAPLNATSWQSDGNN